MVGAACLNCNATLHGPFCASCGQRHIAVSQMGLATVLLEGFDFWRDKFALFRDLGWLLVSPGRLTRKWLAGERVRHLNPVKVWILCSAAMAFAYNAIETDEVWLGPYTERAVTLTCEQAKGIGWLRALNGALESLIGAVWTLLVFPLTARVVLGPHRLGASGYLVASLHASAATGLTSGVALCVWDVARQLLEHDPLNTDVLVAGAVVSLLFGLMTQVAYTLSVLWSGLSLSFRQALAVSVVSIGVLIGSTFVFTLSVWLVMRAVVEAVLATPP